MAVPEGEPPIPLTEASFVEYYGESNGRFGSSELPLKFALAMEARFCTTPEAKRTDPDVRMAYLAGCLMAAGSLHPDHVYLAPSVESQ